jgi:hypothetical protein
MEEVDRPIAALFVETDGVYFGLDGVEPYDKRRDARLYAGTKPVVCHPPCARWGRLAEGAFGKVYSGVGDSGEFQAALEAVNRCGGVLEHPEGSRAWDAFGLTRPIDGAWTFDGRGWVCCIAQGHFGHDTRKRTWLYAAHVTLLPSFQWWASLPAGDAFTLLSKKKRNATPVAFRDMLIRMARSVAHPRHN